MQLEKYPNMIKTKLLVGRLGVEPRKSQNFEFCRFTSLRNSPSNLRVSPISPYRHLTKNWCPAPDSNRETTDILSIVAIPVSLAGH